MKRNKLLISISFALAMMFNTSVYAQFDQIGSFMAGSAEDAEKLFGAYITPYANGIGAGLSAGWYNTAKVHKLGGFDVTFSLNAAIIPSADKSFDLTTLGLGEGSSLVSRVEFSENESPTAAGSKSAGPQVTYYTELPVVGETELASFNLPKGSGFGYTPTPMVQIGLGLVKETEVVVRYSPELSLGDGGKVGLWGVGVKHGIKQWIPALKRLPIFEMSVQGGYTKLYSNNSISFTPEFYDGYATDYTVFSDFYDGQEMNIDVSNITANLLLSVNLPVLCVYGGAGYSSSSANLSLTGNYPFPVVQGGQLIIDESSAQEDPIDIDINKSDFRLNAGFRIKMAVVTLHFDYTYADYSIASAGLGISLR